ncbi:hypothetical protein KL942_001311 [Ogataea angusta]|uniref:WSC domain-containing protein n=1 Tax=Pichia angusta TaxID=870730 RepID=A0ABQ7S0V9_PICAN|nr:hypothetical protein KL942_001311 [Ogataea angusta]KAG7850991.1 hypothetical protein KL940_001568 [Ogataea angusta]
MLIWFFLVSLGSALEQALCSKENTGSVTTNNIWMSNGYCSDFCKEYRYAIVQGEDCWCSNTAPDDTSDLDNCDTTCPGYGYEDCGGDGYYGYIKVGDTSDDSGSSSSSADQSSTADRSTSSSTANTQASSSSETVSSETPSSDSTYADSNSDSTSSEIQEASATTDSSSSSTSATSSSSSSSTSSTTHSSTSTSSSSASPSSSSTASSSSVSSSTTSTSATPTSSEASSATSIPSSAALSSTSSSSSQTLALSTSSYLSSSQGSGISTALVTTMIKTTITYTPASSATEINKSSPSSTATNSSKDSSSFFDHKGKVAAVFSVVGIVSLALILLLTFILRKMYLNKHKGPIAIESDTESFEKPVIIGTLPNTPTPSSPPPSASAKRASVFSLHRKSNSAPTAVQRPTPLSDMVMVDQRLDPHSELYNNNNYSTRSLSDQVDYSRKVLRVANPDA